MMENIIIELHQKQRHKFNQIKSIHIATNPNKNLEI